MYIRSLGVSQMKMHCCCVVFFAFSASVLQASDDFHRLQEKRFMRLQDELRSIRGSHKAFDIKLEHFELLKGSAQSLREPFRTDMLNDIDKAIEVAKTLPPLADPHEEKPRPIYGVEHFLYWDFNRAIITTAIVLGFFLWLYVRIAGWYVPQVVVPNADDRE